jgi:hypothetical protein
MFESIVLLITVAFVVFVILFINLLTILWGLCLSLLPPSIPPEDKRNGKITSSTK